MVKKTRRFKGETYRKSVFEDVDWWGIRKTAEYSGRKYRIIPSMKDRGWWLYLGRKK